MTTYEDELEVTALLDATESDFRSFPLVLTWPALTSDRDAMIRLQNRRLTVEKAKEERVQGKLAPDSEIELTDSESCSSGPKQTWVDSTGPVWWT